LSQICGITLSPDCALCLATVPWHAIAVKDFFVSYNSADKTWAEWIAWVLEENGYTVVIQAWDFRPGGNFILDMQRAAAESHRTIMVLSEDYLKAKYTQPEWAAAFKQDPTAEERRLIPMRVAKCTPTGLLAPLVYVDLVEKTEADAEQLVLAALKDRAKPATRPSFPDIASAAARVTDQKIEFPGLATAPNNLPRSGAIEFVGRDQELTNLHTQLHQVDRLAITALRGMGGIGKTELALQYALHHREQGTYPGGICWLQAKEQNIGTEIVNFALVYLNLTPPDGLDLPNQVAYIWHHWPHPVGAHGGAPSATSPPTPDPPGDQPGKTLGQKAQDPALGAQPCAPTSGNVLMVIDDVSGTDANAAYNAIKPYLPPQETRFRVLLTTRLQLGASIQTVQIDVLSEAASLELLRSLIGGDRVDSELATARALCHWLGYLPLGLELVGRFLARKPTWSLTKMQQQLNEKRLAAQALLQGHGDMTATHATVAAAFELSWQDLDESVRELAYRLSLFALAPIDWLWIEQWCKGTDPYDLEDWRDEGLVNRSLLTGDGQDDWQLHQIIREFFRTKLDQWPMGEALKQSYCQAMVQVAQGIPDIPNREQILAVTPTIPHLVEAATTWRQWLDNDSLGWPFLGLGRFYKGQGAYKQAELWYQVGLMNLRDRLGNEHPDVATSLNNLALLYQMQGRYSEAEPLYYEALQLEQRLLGNDHSSIATCLNNLALLYESQRRYSEAEPLYIEALQLRQKLLGNDHPNVATSLHNLASLYESQGRYSEAEPLYNEALKLRQRLLGDEHPHIATSLHNLAGLYCSQGRYKEAETLYRDALKLSQKLLGNEHPDTSTCLYSLARLHELQGQYTEAEFLYRDALMQYQNLLGDDHPNVATCKSSLASTLRQK
jgi:tetratricopeptide (TPR) repeat protein